MADYMMYTHQLPDKYIQWLVGISDNGGTWLTDVNGDEFGLLYNGQTISGGYGDSLVDHVNRGFTLKTYLDDDSAEILLKVTDMIVDLGGQVPAAIRFADMIKSFNNVMVDSYMTIFKWLGDKWNIMKKA